MKRYAAGAALLALGALAVVLRPSRALGVLRAALASPWFPVLLVALYAIRPLLAWPISLLSALVGFKYGLAMGVPIALAGAVATSIPPFVAGRRAPGGGRFLRRFTDGSSRYFAAAGNFRGIVAARLAPTPPEAISAAAGAGGVSYRTFALGTLVGELPWVVAAVAVGSSLEAFTVAGADVDLAYVVVGVLAAVVLLAPVAYRTLGARLRT